MAKVEFQEEEIRYLSMLQKQFPTIESAISEQINLEAILNLPKGTEHFISDLHGEHESFIHILKNASGVIRRKIDDLFAETESLEVRDRLATLVYYPEQKLELLHKNGMATPEWYKKTLIQLVQLCQEIGSKYTRSKVRKALPQEFSYIIEQLLYWQGEPESRRDYHEAILNSILETHCADELISALSHSISRLAIDHLHIIGDIYDRGSGAVQIMDVLEKYHHVDIQWGNHDILWMGAAAGSKICMMQVIINCVKYDNLDTLEEGYGISMRHLSAFANHTYGNEYEAFIPIMRSESPSDSDVRYLSRLHKTAVVILLKLEHQLITAHPEYRMHKRLILSHMDLEKGTVEIEGKKFEMKDKLLLTMDPRKPWELTEAEQEVLERIAHAFRHSEKLQRHIRFLFRRGSMALRLNGNLLYHGCIPMEKDGSFTITEVCGEPLSGRAYIEKAEQMVRKGYFLPGGSPEKENLLDFYWYLWCGPNSPLFGREKMATFERYFLTDPVIQEEKKNPYYERIQEAECAKKILEEFDLDPEKGHIVNGHVPVQVRKGESPVHAGGKLFIIDGGLSKAYQKRTGIAGYTLIFDSRELQLVSHEPFTSVREAVSKEQDIHAALAYREYCPKRLKVADTDNGKKIQKDVEDLKRLTMALRSGALH